VSFTRETFHEFGFDTPTLRTLVKPPVDRSVKVFDLYLLKIGLNLGAEDRQPPSPACHPTVARLREFFAMKSASNFCFISLCALSALLLASCGGGSPASTGSGSGSGSGSTTSYQLTVTAPATGAGTITSSPAGISCPGTCTASFTQSTQVTLSETPGTNYFFGGWSGSCTGTSTCTVTMSAAESVSATFNAGIGLTVAESGTGTGAVTSSPAGITCPGTCSAEFAPNSQVTLTATPNSNYSFVGWGGNCSGTSACTVTLSASESITATFNAPVTDIALTVSLAGAGAGTVTSTPAGINCSATSTACSLSFAPGTTVTLTETPVTTNTFAGWSGACTGSTACSVTLNAASTVTATFGGSIKTNINHIILFAQENRSFDHYFGYMRQYWASIGIPDQSFDGLPQFNPVSGVAPLQGPVPSVPGCQLSSDADQCNPDPTNQIQSFSFHTLQLNSGNVGTVCEENQSPFWNEAHNDWDYTNAADQPAEVNAQGQPNPPLNGFVYTAAYDARSNAYMDVNGVRGMGYFQDADLNFYYALATDFATSDRWFSPVMDRTQINRAYLFAATSQGYGYPPGGGNTTVDGNAFTATTIFQALQAAGITWKIYVDPTNATYKNSSGVTEDCSTEPAGQAQDMCLAGVSYINEFNYETQIQNPATNLWQHFGPISDLPNDMQNDTTFPQFAFIEPASEAGYDEHPSDADGSPVNVQLGAQYVQKTIVQPFLQSAIWPDSVMIFTYDEAGGLYDHVPPQPATPPGDDLYPLDLVAGDICTNSGQTLGQGTCTFGWTGYRVPLVVISPYTQKNFVSHSVRDTTAVLAMVEDRFGIAPLTNRDASYSASQTTNATMAEFFDFVNKPWATAPTNLPAQTTYPNGIDNCDQTPPTAWNEPPEVQVQVTGSGMVSSSPTSAIDNCTTYCTGVFSTATIVTLTATPNTGSTFTGWGGACTGTTTCSVTPTALSTVTATFMP
jgi:phospholipase C